MTKSELRKARKEARREGRPLIGELRTPDNRSDSMEFTESARGYRVQENGGRSNTTN